MIQIFIFLFIFLFLFGDIYLYSYNNILELSNFYYSFIITYLITFIFCIPFFFESKKNINKILDFNNLIFYLYLFGLIILKLILYLFNEFINYIFSSLILVLLTSFLIGYNSNKEKAEIKFKLLFGCFILFLILYFSLPFFNEPYSLLILNFVFRNSELSFW